MQSSRGLANLLVLFFLLILCVALGIAYVSTQHTAHVEINGVPFELRTHQRTASGILRELHIQMQPGDLLEVPETEALIEGAPLRLTAAREMVLLHDGTVSSVRTQTSSIGAAIAETEVNLRDEDMLILDKRPCTLDTPLPAPLPSDETTAFAWLFELRRPIRLTLRRAISVTVLNGAEERALYTTAGTVGEVLYDHGLRIYAADQVEPALSEPLAPDMEIVITRSQPLMLDVGGVQRQMRTLETVVGDLLKAEGVALEGKDYVLPQAGATIAPDSLVRVVRALDSYYVEEEPIAFEIQRLPDAGVEIDDYKITVWGREGARRRRIHIYYENGVEVYRSEEEEWIAQEPVDRQINYGTKIVLRELVTPEGTFTYWRRLRMLATSYNAPTAGKSMSHPTYAITRVGWRAAKGIIAVDPRVISLYQNMYVPGYGSGVAGDTGSAILWRRVDLCFDDDNLELWKKWVDVYLLTPVPDPEEINYIVPNWPIEQG